MLRLIANVMVLLISAASGVLVGAAPASARPGDLAAAMEQVFVPLMAEHDVPGMAVAVTVDGQRHHFNYGVASRTDGSPVKSETLFEIGSLSKTFTATLATYAQQQGVISLTDHPGGHLPELAGSGIDEANLLNLGTYTAGGLPLQFPDDVDDDATMLAYFRNWVPDSAPGRQRQYSNPSIGLLGHVAARAMGGGYSTLIERQIFPGLGLSQSYIDVPDIEMGRYAQGYTARNEPARVNLGALGAEAYGVKASATDMVTFLEANISPERLDAPMRRAVEATHTGHFEVAGMVQGLGWEQYPFPVSLDRLLAGNSPTVAMQPNPAVPVSPRPPAGPALFNKTGSTNGFGAYAAFVPDERTGIVMLANKNFPIAARVTAAHEILEQLSSD